jgi:hypothetical protein
VGDASSEESTSVNERNEADGSFCEAKGKWSAMVGARRRRRRKSWNPTGRVEVNKKIKKHKTHSHCDNIIDSAVSLAWEGK